MKIIKWLYASFIKWRDGHFCDYCQCSVGDIIMLRDTPSNNQLLLTSRLIDVESYFEKSDMSFSYQNRISYKAYGEAHKKERGNKHFRDLIESYKAVGYRDDSYVTCDNTFTLMDGNHRMGIHLYKGYNTINVRMVHRKVRFEYGADWYYRAGLESDFMEELYDRYNEVQKWLVDTGNTFCAVIHTRNSKSAQKHMSPVSDLKKLTTPLHEATLEEAGVIILQFSLINPRYKVEKGELISLRAKEVLKIMNKRYGDSIRIEVSKSCYEGKKIWDYYNSKKQTKMKKLKLYKHMWVPEGEMHLLSSLSEQEIKGYLSKGGIVVKNPYDFDCKVETTYWYVIKDSYGGIEELSSKMRNQIRKSLKTYEIDKVDRDTFISIARDIFNKALNAYTVKAKPMDEESFKRACEGWKENTDFWCAFMKDSHLPVALAVNGVFKESVQYWVLKADPAFLHNSTYPYYGLIHTMNEYYLNQQGKKYVSDGARTLTLHSNIQEFLIEKFNFRKAYCRLQVVWAPWIKPVIQVLYPIRKWIKPLQLKALLNLEMMKREGAE